MFAFLRYALPTRVQINQLVQTRSQRLLGLLLLIALTGLLGACSSDGCDDYEIVGYLPWSAAIVCEDPDSDPLISDGKLGFDLNSYRNMASLNLLGNGKVLNAGNSVAFRKMASLTLLGNGKVPSPAVRRTLFSWPAPSCMTRPRKHGAQPAA